jgi:hypothetical protein
MQKNKKEGLLYCLLIFSFVTALPVFFSGCGENEEPAKKNEVKKRVEANPLAEVAKSAKKTEKSGFKSCITECRNNCQFKKTDKIAYYTKISEEAANAPFEMTVIRAYLDGECARGDVPEKRKNTRGIKAVVEGFINYTGSDLLIDAAIDGSMYLNINGSRAAEAPAHLPSLKDKKNVSELLTPVRGADPWLANQKRHFHFETLPISEGFCEITPKETVVLIKAKTTGIVSGEKNYVLGAVKIPWDQVVGMALNQQIMVLSKNDTWEPADAQYSKFDKVLLTRLTGKTEWIKRGSTMDKSPLKRGTDVSFPVQVSSDKWQIQISSIAGSKKFGSYTPKGEDKFLAILDVTLVNTGVEESNVGNFRARLEVAPNVWRSPVATALGQLSTSEKLAAGSSISGKLVFLRTRFERPFRVQFYLPDGNNVYLDVFKYKIGPKRSPLK